MGSASTAQPVSAASRAAGSATSSATGPHTIAPRGLSAMRSASAWTSVPSGALECAGRRVHGLPSGRPSQSAASKPSSGTGASGSRRPKFRWTGPWAAVWNARQASAR